MKRFEVCSCCGYIYTSENEEPDTLSEYDNPEENASTDWECPICGQYHEPLFARFSKTEKNNLQL
jgi:Rubredoxin.